MGRINSEMSLMDAAVAMSEGNPGAATALAELIKSAARVNPHCGLEDFGPLLSLDTHEIYGPHIWVLFKDQCRQNPREVLMLLKAVDFGFLSPQRFKKIVDYRNPDNLLTKDEMDDLNEKIMERFPGFEKRK